MRLGLRPVTCDLQLATCDLRPATCDLRPAACDLRLATNDLLLVICGLLQNDQLTLERGQALGPIGDDQHVVLDPHAADAEDIDARLDGEGGAGRERLAA